MNINPCLFMPENWVIAFHRKCLASIILIELFFILFLRLVSFCCKRNPYQIQQPQLQMKEDNIIKVEVIQTSNIQLKSTLPFSMQASHLQFTSKSKTTKNQSKKPIVSSQTPVYLSKTLKQSKPIIEIKKLALDQQDIEYIICVELGHQFLCIALALMYYPFAFTTLTCATQLLLFITHYLLRIFSEGLITKLTKGALFSLNIVMMVLSIYGLCTNIPQLKLNSCFDL